MNLEPPQPPTAPAPAMRPTPPTPPRIDKTPFVRDSSNDSPQVTREVTTPEDMARDAVANGSGALTKRTVERGNDEQALPSNQNVIVIPPDAPLISDNQSDYGRGQAVLREFQELDARDSQTNYNPPTQTSEETPHQVVPRLNYHEGHGGFFWIFAIIFVATATFFIVRKFLLTDKPALTKSQLFEDSTKKLRATVDKVKPVKPSPKPVKVPTKKSDDDKGKHFEVRV